MAENYAGLEAELYDELWRDELDDVDLYRDIVRDRGGRALDLGCGTGRVLIPLLQAGLEVVGLDPAPEMLAICRRKAEAAGIEAELHCARMEDFDLSEHFAVILIPAYSFQLVHPIEKAAEGLANFHRHLVRGGQLVLSVFMPFVEAGFDEGEGQWHLRKEVTRASDGARIACYQSNRFDRAERMIHVQNRYSIFDFEGRQVATQIAEMDILWHDPNELAAMLIDAGFSNVEVLGGDQPDEDDNATCFLIATA